MFADAVYVAGLNQSAAGSESLEVASENIVSNDSNLSTSFLELFNLLSQLPKTHIKKPAMRDKKK